MLTDNDVAPLTVGDSVAPLTFDDLLKPYKEASENFPDVYYGKPWRECSCPWCDRCPTCGRRARPWYSAYPVWC